MYETTYEVDQPNLAILKKESSLFQGSPDYTITVLNSYTIEFYNDDVFCREIDKSSSDTEIWLHMLCKADNTSAVFLLKQNRSEDYYQEFINEIIDRDRKKGDSLRHRRKGNS